MISINTILLVGLYVSILIVGMSLRAIVFFFRRLAVNRLLKVTQRKTNRTIIEAREEAKKIIEHLKSTVIKSEQLLTPNTVSAVWITTAGKPAAF